VVDKRCSRHDVGGDETHHHITSVLELNRTLVLSLDQDRETYVHRIGRTGRMGKQVR
jgi:hypothetical protein